MITGLIDRKIITEFDVNKLCEYIVSDIGIEYIKDYFFNYDIKQLTNNEKTISRYIGNLRIIINYVIDSGLSDKCETYTIKAIDNEPELKKCVNFYNKQIKTIYTHDEDYEIIKEHSIYCKYKNKWIKVYDSADRTVIIGKTWISHLLVAANNILDRQIYLNEQEVKQIKQEQEDKRQEFIDNFDKY